MITPIFIPTGSVCNSCSAAGTDIAHPVLLLLTCVAPVFLGLLSAAIGLMLSPFCKCRTVGLFMDTSLFLLGVSITGFIIWATAEVVSGI